MSIPYAVYRLLVRWKQFYRVTTFAADNGLSYENAIKDPDWQGMIFDHRYERRASTSVYRPLSMPTFEVANYRYFIRLRKLERFEWGYIAIELASEFPQRVVLRSRSAASDKRWALSQYSRNPVIPLNAEADHVFRLYCPVGAEADARSVFTPGLLSKLVAFRGGKGIDAEIFGKYLFIYSTRPFKLRKMKTLTQLFAIVSDALPVTA